MAFAALMKASGKTLLTTVAVTAIGFISSVITARILGPEGRGLLSGSLLIATLSGSISSFGMANSFIYHKGAGRIFNYRALLIFSVIATSVIGTVLAYIGLQLGNPVLFQVMGLILVLSAITTAQGYFNTLSQLRDDLHFFNFMRFALVFGNLILLLVLIVAFQPIDFKKILVTQLIVTAALMVAGMIWASRNAFRPNYKESQQTLRWRDIFWYGARHHGTVVLGLLLVNFDKMALLKMGTIVEYGYYALAFTTSRLIGAVQEAVATAIYARHAGQDTEELNRNVNTAYRLTFFPMLVIAAIGAALSPWLIVLVYGKAFASMAAPFAILLFECVISGAGWTLAQRFNASGRPGLVFIRQFISVLPVFAAIPFLPKENIHVYLAGLMLLGGLLRLVVTLGIYPLVLKERMPSAMPTKNDIQSALKLLRRRKQG